MVKRDWKKIWILGIITGGIYNWYIIWSMHNDLHKMEQKTNQQGMNWILFFLLSFCTGTLFAFIEGYIYHKKALALAKTYNVKLAIKSPVLYSLIAMYVPIFSYKLVIDNHNKLIEGYEASYAYKTN